MNKLSKFINNPWIAFVFAAGYGLTNWVPVEPHLKAMFRVTVGEKLDLKNPKTFNEKLQWLKLHDKNPLYNTLVDKYRVKPWVAERIGEEHCYCDAVEAIKALEVREYGSDYAD